MGGLTSDPTTNTKTGLLSIKVNDEHENTKSKATPDSNKRCTT